MNIYTTATLLGVIQEMARFQPFLLDLLFGRQVNFTTSEIAFDKLIDDMQLAPFVSPRVAGRVNRQDGSQLQAFKPAYLKPKDAIDPERVLQRLAGEGLGGVLAPDQRRNAIVVDILDSHRKKILRRLESMAWQIPLAGKIIVKGEDYPEQEVDFKRDADKTVVKAGGGLWTDKDNSSPLEDLAEWFTRVTAPTTHILYGVDAYKAFSTHPETKDLIESRRGSDTKLENAPDTNLSSFKGRLGDSGPELWVCQGWYKDEEMQKQTFLPSDSVVLVSTGVQGIRAYGAILDGRAGYQSMDLFPKSWLNDDPSEEYIMTQSAPLPVLPDINSTLSAKVV